MTLIDTIESLSGPELLTWFVENAVHGRGFWRWPDLYFITQEPHMKWWTDTAALLQSSHRLTVISDKTAIRLMRDLKEWLLWAAEQNYHAW